MSNLPSIESIGRIMAEQNNRATQYPLFVIQQEVRKFVPVDDDYDERERTEEIHEYWLCDACHALIANDNDIPPECEKCDEDAFVHYVIEHEFVITQAGVFFTDVAAQQHIDQNSYHYRNARVYGICAWRNPEMVSVMQHLIKSADKEIPSHYEGTGR